MSFEAIVKQYSSNPSLISPRFSACQKKIQSNSVSSQVFTSFTTTSNKLSVGQAPLMGLTYSVKENIAIKARATSLGSAQLRLPPNECDAKVIEYLDGLGAQLIGTTAMDDYALGCLGESSLSGRLQNPIRPDRICGGSSGGAASSVANDLVDFAVGTDSGGSVRIPAAACDIMALKLSSNSLPREGTYFMHDSLDSFGIFTRTAGDLVWLCERIPVLASHTDNQSNLTLVSPTTRELMVCSQEVLVPFGELCRRLSLSRSLKSLDHEIGFSAALEARKIIIAKSFTKFVSKYGVEPGKLSDEGLALLRLAETDYKNSLAASDLSSCPIFRDQVLLTPALPEPPPTWPDPTTKAPLNYFMAIVNLYDLVAVVFPVRVRDSTHSYQLIGSKGLEITLCRLAENIQKAIQP